MAGVEELHHDEQTLAKVYAALLKHGIFGQKAVDIVSDIQNEGILFREQKPKRRGRPPKDNATIHENTQALMKETKDSSDAWAEANVSQS